MITVKFKPKLITNDGMISKNVEFIPSKTVKYYVEASGFKSDDVIFVKTGFRVDEYCLVHEHDEIIILPCVGDPGTIAAIIAITKLIIAIISIAASIYSIVSAITNRPKRPSYNSLGDGLTDGSPTYGWDGIQDTSDVGIPVGVVYGEFRVGGEIIGRYVNTDGDNNYLNVLLALGEGEIESIDSIEINQNPVANYSGISYNTRLGTNSQSPVDNFQQTHDLRSVAQTLLSSSTVTYTTFASDVQAFELHFLFQNGLFQQDQKSGAIVSYSVTYNVKYKKHTDVSYTDLGNFTISAGSRTAVRRIFRKDGLDADQYDIQVTKITADSDLYHQTDMQWDTTDEITNDDLAYPNTALLSITALATNQLSGQEPTITSLVKGRKISQPKVMNGASEVDWEDYYWNSDHNEYRLLSTDASLTWDGSTYVTKWGANPVWCLMDFLISSRFGLGNFIDTSMIDLATFVSMSQYCDGKVGDGIGGYEKRFRLDVVLDSNTRAVDLINQIAQSFRGLVYYSGGLIKIKIDKQDTPIQLFGMGNIIAGSWQETFVSVKQRYNIIEVQFLNKDLNYRRDLLSVIDEAALSAGDPIRKKQIQVFCTRASQAFREGRFNLWINKYIRRTVALKAGIDAIICEAGDLINVAHDVPAWGVGSGRVDTGSTSTVINIDQPITLESGKTYAIMIQHNDGTIEDKTITTLPGVVQTVTVGSAFSFTPAVYDTYSIGQVSVEVKPFRVVSIKVNNDHTAEINAIEYNANIYDDTPPPLSSLNYSALDTDIPDVTDLKLTSGVVLLNDGTVQSSIDVWFNRPSASSVHVMYAKAKIYLSDDGGSRWRFEGETLDGHFQIVDSIVDGLNYMVAVVSVGANGNAKLPDNSPQATILSIGKSAPPSDVPTFLVNQSRDSIFFGWAEVPDLDLYGYEIRYGDSWDAGLVLATGVKHSNYISDNIHIGSGQKFFIKAIDTTGNYSANATQATVTIDNIPFQNIIMDFMEAGAWAGTLDSTVVVSSVLLISTGVLSGKYTTPVRDLGYVATFKIGIASIVVSGGGDRRFDDDATTTFADDEFARFSGEEIAGASTFEIKTSNDNVTWSAWAPWQLGDYTCRYFQIRMTLARGNIGDDIQCSDLTYYADLPDVDDFGSDTVSVAGSGKAITFNKTYHQAPVVDISILSGTGVYAGFSSIPDTTGFTVKLYNTSGTAVTGDFAWKAHGI